MILKHFHHFFWFRVSVFVLLILIFSGAAFLIGRSYLPRFQGASPQQYSESFSSESLSVADYNSKAQRSGLSFLPPTPSSGDLDQYANVGPKVIRSGSLGMDVKNAYDTMEEIEALVENYKGFVESSQTWLESNESVSGVMSLRVPAESFDRISDEIKALAVVVRSESFSAQDVTEQYIDLDARLKTLKAEEAQYLEILGRATEVEDVLKVTDYLSNVRSEIESLQGQFNYLSNQVDYSMLTVSLYEEASVIAPTRDWQPFVVLKEAINGLIVFAQGAVNVLIWGLIFALPVLLLLVLIHKGMAEGKRFFRKKK